MQIHRVTGRDTCICTGQARRVTEAERKVGEVGHGHLHGASEKRAVGAQPQVGGLDAVKFGEVDQIEGDEVEGVHLEDAHGRPAVHLRAMKDIRLCARHPRV